MTNLVNKIEIIQRFPRLSPIKLPKGSLLNNYLISRLSQPFIFSLGLFLALSISLTTGYQLILEMTNSGLNLSLIFALKLLLLKLPSLLSYALPLSILLGTVITYNTLASHNEIIAFRAIGIGVLRLLTPIFIIGLLLTGFTFVIDNFLTPITHHQAQIILREELTNTKPLLKERNLIVTHYKSVSTKGGEKKVLSHLFYAKAYDGQTMKEVTVLDNHLSNFKQIVTAEVATWDRKQNNWEFKNGEATIIDPEDFSSFYTLKFKTKRLLLPPIDVDLLETKGFNYDGLNYWELRHKIDQMKEGVDLNTRQRMKINLHQKLSLPFACLVFAFLGAVFGLKFTSEDNSIHLLIFVLFVFCYYLVGNVAESVAIQGLIAPVIASWLSNVLTLVITLFLLCLPEEKTLPTWKGK